MANFVKTADRSKKEDNLEAKLELLHNCMLFSATPPELSAILNDYSVAFARFIITVKGKSLLDEDKIYIAALTELRIALLGS